MKTSVNEFTKIDGNTTSFLMNGIESKAQIGIKQNVDPVLMKSKLKTDVQPDDEVLLTTERQDKHYKANEDLLIFEDGLLFRKYYRDIGSVKYHQVLIP